MSSPDAASTQRIVRLVGVYDADSTLRGELTYWVGARLGRRHCSLCEITHGSVRQLGYGTRDGAAKEADGVVKLVVQELIVNAPAQVLYELLTDPVQFVQWMADDATLDPRPGGVVRWTHANGDTCSGEYVELLPGRRVVFTYGWERADVEIPPGSTTVEIDLTPTSDTTTLLRLVHRGLDDLAAGAHHGGWLHYLDRLRQRAEGAEPGPDPFVTQRVPTPAELRR